MKLSKISIIAAVALLVTSMFPAVAQDTSSPYSKFGYGILRDNATSAQRQMGGVGYAMNSGRQINAMNPASYAMIDTLTFLFDTGVTLTNMWSKENGTSEYTTGGGLDYITMQFPLGRYMGGSFGLIPYSSVGYSFGSKIDNGTSTRSGEGGLNQLYLGVSGRPFSNFSLGFNFSYLFGTTYNNVFVASSLGTTSRFSQEMQVRDWHIELGAQYTIPINQRNRVTLGLTYSPSKTLLGHTMVTTGEFKNDGIVVNDTVLRQSLKDRASLPETWGAGINYQWNSRLMVEADFTYQNWKDAKFPQHENFIGTQFQNRWKVALGSQYVINPRGNYGQRISYRIGGYFGNDYITVNGNGVKEWGLTCGFGLPAPGQKTVINLGFEYRNRKASPDPLLRENYFNITLGINFNEVWFWQNKIK